jgi:hypothetical protein
MEVKKTQRIKDLQDSSHELDTRRKKGKFFQLQTLRPHGKDTIRDQAVDLPRLAPELTSAIFGGGKPTNGPSTNANLLPV